MQYVLARTSRLGNRTVNQDRLVILERDNTVVLAIGDGLGGKSGGELAAQALIDVVTDSFNHSKLPVRKPDAFLTDILHRAHHAVINAGKQQDPPVNPGTTAVLCLIQDNSAWWAHVGDSRLYLFRGGVPIYRTRDHSVVEKLYERGQLTKDKRNAHPMKNYMTRCIGLSDTVPEVTVSNEVSLHPGDIIMLCSDGLWEPLDDMLIGSILLEGKFKDALNKVSEFAEKASYPNSDNITAVAIQIMSLQLIGKAMSDPADKPNHTGRRPDPVQNAIDVIEQTIKLYEHEMK